MRRSQLNNEEVMLVEENFVLLFEILFFSVEFQTIGIDSVVLVLDSLNTWNLLNRHHF